MNTIASLSLMLDGETRDIETPIQGPDGQPTSIGWRLRRVSSADVGTLLNGVPSSPADPSSSPPDPMEATRRSFGIVCAAVVAVRMPGQPWTPITLTMGGEPDDAAGTMPIARLGFARIRALSDAVTAMILEGGDAIARFLG